MKIAWRRIMIVVVGLLLGWWAAGVVDFTPQVDAATEEAPHQDVHAAEAAHQDANQQAADALVPRDDDSQKAAPSWYRLVVYAAAGLFVAAILIGVPIVRRQASDAAADVKVAD